YTKDVVDALYAYTLCEQKISVNCLVIRDKLPHVCTVSDVIRYHADHIIEVSKKELEVQRGHLFDKLHTRTLERIFIEERIYKRIEQKRTQEAVVQAIRTGFEPYVDQLVREITDDDIDHLLKIPIRRISLFDIEKNKEEIDQINADIRQVDYDLTHLDEYSIRTLNGIKADLDNEDHQRKTVIADFNMVDVRDVAKRDFDLRYDGMTGYLGTNVKTGNVLFKVSEFDKILIIQKNGTYYCANVSDRLFVGKDISYCGLADKESLEDLVFTVIYLDKKTKVTYIKRCKLSGFILNKPYELLPDPENNSLKKLSVLPNAEVTVTYKGPTRVKESTFLFSDFLVKGAKAGGVTITKKDIASIRIKPCKLVEGSKPETAASEEEDDEPEIETVAESGDETPETKVKPEPKATRKQSDDDMPGLFDDV
ncbi:MAG: DNA topoisomerase IV subunit A, partial [Spirochaetales bacterium]|nr:DNA topoisomerase IV subunit A [Spirochaetales bacterium]